MVRDQGFAYAELEKNGIGMPVYSVEAKYRSALRYDELITIETTLRELPAARIEFYYRIFNGEGVLAHILDEQEWRRTRGRRCILHRPLVIGVR